MIEIMGFGLMIISLWTHFHARRENCCQSLGLSSGKIFVDSQVGNVKALKVTEFQGEIIIVPHFK